MSWRQTFSEEFNGNTVDQNVWSARDFWGFQNSLWKGDRQGWDDYNQISVSNGSATFNTINTPPPPNTVPDTGNLIATAGTLNTSQSFNQAYGYFEARIKLAPGQGIESAFSLRIPGGNFPTIPPEIGVVEGVGQKLSSVYLPYFDNNPDGSIKSILNETQVSNPYDNFHTYGLDWKPGSLTWYIDGIKAASLVSDTLYGQPLYLSLDTAVGNKITGDPSPEFLDPNNQGKITTAMQVDYVHVYTRIDDGISTTLPPGVSADPTAPPVTPAPTGSFPLTGTRVTFDGTTNVTATKGDALILTVDPQNFNGAAEQNGNVVLSSIDGQAATIQNAFLTSDGIPNVYVPQGDFLVGRDGFSITSTKQNSILIGLPGSEEINNIVDPSLAAGSHFISGGIGRFDQTDGADTITIGGKGKWAVYANAGADIVTQDGAATSGFDSASVVNVYGQEGNDSITLTNAANTKASIFVSGGTEADSITVVNSGSTTIFGGVDSADGNDHINFNIAGGASGNSVIFGNGGADSIFVGYNNSLGAGIDSSSTSTVYGGFGNDFIVAQGTKATISILGNEGADSIAVLNTGNTFITGGNESGDQSLDGGDLIQFIGSGNVLVYGNAGADSITLNLQGTDSSVTSDVSVYGGKDNDLINVQASGAGKATIFVAGGENSDNITVAGNGGATTIYGGISNADSADGADTISYRGDGTANIFGNGGDDSIRIGTLGTADSTNATVTVSGGGGADSITVTAQASTSQTLNLSGNEGNDTFTIAKGTGQTITVTDFATGGDKLALTGLGGTPGQLQLTTGSFQTLQQALDAAANTANGASGASKAAAVAFAGSTYVVIDSTAGAGFQATDQAIKLTGVTDLVGLIGSTSLVA